MNDHEKDAQFIVAAYAKAAAEIGGGLSPKAKCSYKADRDTFVLQYEANGKPRFIEYENAQVGGCGTGDADAQAHVLAPLRASLEKGLAESRME